MTTQLFRPQILWSSLRRISSARCYTTISGVTASINNTPPTFETTTTTESTTSIKLQNTDQTVLNLLSTLTTFPNSNSLHSQVRTLTKRLKTPNVTPIRIGLIGSKTSLLNSLLIDIYEDSQRDKLWYDALTQRDGGVDNVISYTNEESQIVTDKENGRFIVPSPILKDLNIEFVEVNGGKSEKLTSSCSFFLNFSTSERATLLTAGFPTYTFKDLQCSDEANEVLGYTEIDSARYERIIKLLKRSPSNSTIYSKEYPLTNIAQFREILGKAISQADNKLYAAIISNLQTQLSTSSLSLNQLQNQTQHLNKIISSYAEYLNLTFQRQFKPSFHQFQFKTLAWWKLYTSLNAIPAKFHNFLDNDKFLNDSIKQYSYIQGQISTSSESEFIDNQQEIITQDNPLIELKSEILTKDIPALTKRGNDLLYTNFINFQLPLIALSNFGVILLDFSTYSMASVALLGLVIGFNNISRDWAKYTKSWEIEVLEGFRGRINNVEKQLKNEVELWSQNEKTEVIKREDCYKKLTEGK
ncbi:hypothetical protein WICPIJ_006302 [Wickerhamomyces pijperi]|uniref:Mmc1 C-terminal domain-containing protein n=1 Tax=Wickerhamomyces pijperi TaxID=599730 RepID=A0A9P8TLI7_WICPI|nr:hypothetical protein WICPIJ_006302 [Wickerhamomyces pijperi]